MPSLVVASARRASLLAPLVAGLGAGGGGLMYVADGVTTGRGAAAGKAGPNLGFTGFGTGFVLARGGLVLPIPVVERFGLFGLLCWVPDDPPPCRLLALRAIPHHVSYLVELAFLLATAQCRD